MDPFVIADSTIDILEIIITLRIKHQLKTSYLTSTMENR